MAGCRGGGVRVGRWDRGLRGGDAGKEIGNEVHLDQHLYEDGFGRKQIPGLGEESAAKGQVGSESTLRTRHL